MPGHSLPRRHHGARVADLQTLLPQKNRRARDLPQSSRPSVSVVHSERAGICPAAEYHRSFLSALSRSPRHGRAVMRQRFLTAASPAILSPALPIQLSLVLERLHSYLTRWALLTSM